MTLKGHFDGKHIVLDEPPPPGFAPNTPVTISIQNGSTAEPTAHDALFDRLLSLAGEDDLPADYSQSHEHFAAGSSKR